jgi:hypothetical protein
MNAKMKVLSLALVGLCGYAGSALAVCPAGPAIAQGGAWTAAPVFQGTATIVTPGYATTACRLASTINLGASSVAFATVEDDSPTNEPRYRAQFIIDLDAQTAPTITKSSTAFSATSTANGPGITLGVFGSSSAWFLSYIVPDANQLSGVTSGSVALAAGENHVEFDLQIGAAGSITLWVNNNVAGSPTVPPIAINNSSVAGIDTAFLGLAGPSLGFIGSYAGPPGVGFDQFDSRRATFIGF